MATIEAFVVTTSKVHSHIGHSGFSIGAQMYTECLCQLFAFFCMSRNPFEKKAGKITKVFVLRAGLHAVCFSRHFYRWRLKIIDDSFPSENNIQHTIQYTLKLFNDLTINYAERFVYAFWCWLDWNVFSTSFTISFIWGSETQGITCLWKREIIWELWNTIVGRLFLSIIILYYIINILNRGLHINEKLCLQVISNKVYLK